MSASNTYLGWLNILFRRFDLDQSRPTSVMRALGICFILGVIVISAAFLMRAMYEAKEHPLWNNERVWTDEHNGMSARTATYSLLISGRLASQVSRAPLDYIVQKTFDQVGLPLLSWGVPESIYYRLNSMFYSWFSGLFVVLLVFAAIRRQVRNYLIFILQMALLFMALLIYYFWPGNFSFSIQMRPYALWNSLWFMILGLFLVQGRLKVWPFAVLFALLAATANAAIYQLFSFGLAFVAIQFLQREKAREIIKTVAKVFFVPVMISLYYIAIDCSTVYGWRDNFNEYLKEFFHFWLTKEMIPILSTLGILSTVMFRELRHITVVFLTMLILYLISPAINYIVLARGVFFSSRHYIYYDLIYAVFCAALAVALPVFVEKIREWS